MASKGQKFASYSLEFKNELKLISIFFTKDT